MIDYLIANEPFKSFHHDGCQARRSVAPIIASVPAFMRRYDCSCQPDLEEPPFVQRRIKELGARFYQYILQWLQCRWVDPLRPHRFLHLHIIMAVPHRSRSLSSTCVHPRIRSTPTTKILELSVAMMASRPCMFWGQSTSVHFLWDKFGPQSSGIPFQSRSHRFA